MTPKEQAARQAFETWWEHEGQEFLYALNTTTDDDIKLVAEVAWKNGAYCAEPAEQEPVAWMQDRNDLYVADQRDKYYTIPLYAAPVRTKDLTDAEIWEIVDNTKPLALDFARAVIAADREKNK